MLQVGIKAPDFSLPDQNGTIHSLHDYAGKRVILYFYPKDQTAGCTKQACGFAERYPQITEKDAVVLGVSKDSVTMIDGPAGFDTDFYRDVYQYVTSHDMSLPENYEHFCSVMDIDSLIDWLIMEGYCANGDILKGNVRYCRSTENGGLWKVVFYDLDATLLRTFNNFYNLLYSPQAYMQQISQIIMPLLKNQAFVERLLTRFAAAIEGPLSNENVLAEIDRLVALIQPETERDAARWHTSLYRWERNVEYLKNFIGGYDYAQYNINTICDILDLDEEQKETWFGGK